MSVWLRSRRVSVAGRFLSPAAKLTMARRVHVMWSSHSLRMPSCRACWRALAAGVAAWWWSAATAEVPPATSAAVTASGTVRRVMTRIVCMPRSRQVRASSYMARAPARRGRSPEAPRAAAPPPRRTAPHSHCDPAPRRLARSPRRAPPRHRARPVAPQERDRHRRGVVAGELAVHEELRRKARQVQRVAGAVRDRADAEERDAMLVGDPRDGGRLLVARVDALGRRGRRLEERLEEAGVGERRRALGERAGVLRRGARQQARSTAGDVAAAGQARHGLAPERV